jgi:CubicO group peptidase (beta-lactamase class C family)
MMNRVLFVVYLIFVFISPSSHASPSDKTTNIEQVIVSTMEAFQIPGVAVAIVHNNEVTFSKGFGVVEHGKPQKVTADTLFGIASNTKAMTAALLAQLVDQHKLSWQTKIIDIIPEFQLPNPYVTNEFTIIDLLSHNSGLGLGAGDLMVWPETNLTNKDIIKGMKHLPQVSSFRSEFAYDNLMYIVAGEIINKITGKPWHEVIQSQIFSPLKMNNTYAFFSQIPHENTNVARAHVPLNGTLNVIGGNFLEKFLSAGSVSSSVNDMALWLNLQLNNGKYSSDKRIFSNTQSKAMWQPRTLLPVSELATVNDKMNFYAYGLGWFLNDYHGVKLVHHSGGILGMVSKVALVPEMDLGIVILTNQQSSYALNALYREIFQEYLDVPEKDWISYYHEKERNAVLKKQSKLARVYGEVDSTSVPPLSLLEYAQTYSDKWYGDINITLKNKVLRMTFAHTVLLKGTLIHHNDNTFIVKWDDRTLEADAYVNFNLNADGSINFATMKAVSQYTDFSFDFHDLKLVPSTVR